MSIDLEKGVCFRIEGEVGKYNTIPLDFFIKFAGDFQNLINTLAEGDLPGDEPIDIKNFRIELVDFKPGSAIPKLAFSRRGEETIGNKLKSHRRLISSQLNSLFEISDLGDYSKIARLYPDPKKRNPVTSGFFQLLNDFGSAPVSIGEFDQSDQSFIQQYKLNVFKESVRDSLIEKPRSVEEPDSENDIAIGRIKLSTKYGKTTKKILDYYPGKNMSLEYAPTEIMTQERSYYLKYPLRCLFEKEKDYFVIQAELLNLIGTGSSIDEAKASFSDEFDFVYQRFNDLKDDQLSPMNQKIRMIINHLVDHIEE